jgi:hypothetical protein
LISSLEYPQIPVDQDSVFQDLLQAELHGGRSREAQARIRINHLLEAAGRHFFDEDGARANVALESGVKLGARVVDFLL